MPAVDADALDALLPQTQCTRCGYPACRPYAEAMAAGEAGPNRCAPGGPETIEALSALLGVPPSPLDPSCGEHTALSLAFIVPEGCIGCAACIAACPVDAIIGARQRMHTVITALCTGCELCVPACPVDCIEMRPPADVQRQWLPADATRARQRHTSRAARLQRLAQRRASRLAALAPPPDTPQAQSTLLQDPVLDEST